MLTHRMLAARKQKSNSRIGQAQSVAGVGGRFVTFEEASTSFTDKISGSAFLDFPTYTDASNLVDVDVTDQNAPVMVARGAPADANANWGDFGSNDFMVFSAGEAITGRNVTMPLSGEWAANGDPYYGGMVSWRFGITSENAGILYTNIILHPYYAIFNYGSSTSPSIFTPWADKYGFREDGVSYMFAAVRRGNEWLHFGVKDGDATGELLGRYVVDADAIDAAKGNTEFSDRWNDTKLFSAYQTSHGAYGATALRCRLKEVDAEGREYWETDTGTACGYPSYPAWPDDKVTTSGSVHSLFYPYEDNDTAYQVPNSPVPLNDTINPSGEAICEHPQKMYCVGALELPEGAPSDEVICNALAYMLGQAKAERKVLDPTLFYGDI